MERVEGTEMNTTTPAERAWRRYDEAVRPETQNVAIEPKTEPGSNPT
jgi:hypothetical protein